MILGIIVGLIWAVSLVIAFMIGYGWGDLKYKNIRDQEEEK